MKVIITILFFFICTYLGATNRYVSPTGNDTNAGTIGAPWRSPDKAALTAVANDSVLFQRGGTYYGTFANTRAGIKVGAYGSGALPIITGLTTITGWTNEGGGIYSKVITSQSATNMVLVDGFQYAVGRFPDAGVGWLTYQSFNTNVSITSSSIGTTNWTGADVVIRKTDFTIERCTVTGQAGTTINYSYPTVSSNATNGFGFFFENDLRTLTSFGEWYHNFSTGKFYMYFGGVDPNTKVVEVATLKHLFTNTQANITVDHINFRGAIDTLMTFAGNTNKLQNSVISYAGGMGVLITSGSGTTVTNNLFHDCNGNGIKTDGTTTITGNEIYGIGRFVGQTIARATTTQNGSVGCNGIYINGNSSIANLNYIHNINSSGIVLRYTGSATIQYNFVDTTMLFLDDGGGIYTSSPNASVRIIDGNIVGNTMGNVSGTDHTGTRCASIYLDESTTNIYVTNNTCYNNTYVGIKLHYAHDNFFYDNTCYNTQYAFQLFNNGGTAIVNNALRRNIFFSKTSMQNVIYAYSTLNDIPNFGIADSNYYARPISDNTSFTYKQASNPSFVNATLAQWQTFVSPQDAHSKKAPKTITNVSELTFVSNPSTTPLIVDFTGFIRMDVTGKLYYNKDTIAPYRSRIYMDNGTTATPTANAGADQALTLPTSSTSVLGTGTAGTGTIISYKWSAISGPNSPTLTTPNSTSTNVTGLIQGSYTLRFVVKNSVGDSAIDFMQILVSAGNISPTANAGPDQSVTLPTSSTTLNGSGSDPDGTITAYLWTKVSGPTGGTISSNTSATTNITSLQQGTYVYSLRVTDNNGATGSDFVQIVVNPANVAPISNAGADQTITLPTSSTSLNGSGSSDPDGTIVSYLWTKISGPTGGALGSPNSVTTTVSSLQQGTYVYQLTVTDNNGATGTDFVQITVNPAVVPPNQPPVSNAGPDQTITLPTSSTTLDGTGSFDPDGTIVAYLWRKISGTGGSITSSTSATTGITGLSAGTYIYQLRVTDNSGDTATDAIQITVNPANVAPTANAGANQVITLPTNSTTLMGSGTDPDGTITGYLWRKLSGPTGGTITSSTSATTGITGLTQGVYLYQLRVTDNVGDTGTAAVQITVNVGNSPPTAAAGADQVITLPTNNTTLDGSGSTDPDGTITAYLWTQLSGPSVVTFGTSTSAITTVGTFIQGTYIFQLKVTDNNGDTAVDAIQVTVNAPIPPPPPTVSAGANQVIQIPLDSVSVTATSPNTIVSYQWVLFSGNGGIIQSPTSQTTEITSIPVGVSKYQVTVTDNNGLTATSIVQITTYPAPAIPGRPVLLRGYINIK